MAIPGRAALMNVNEALKKNLPYLTDNDHLLILSKSKPMRLNAGHIMIRQGFPSTAFYMIRSGAVRVERQGVQLATLGAGSVCGEMTLLEESPASASVITEKEVEVDAVAVGDMNEIFTAFPHLASRFYRSIALNLSAKLRATSARLTDFQNSTPKLEK